MEYSTADIEVKAADTDEVDNAGGFIVDIGSLYDFLNNLQDSRDPRGMRYQLIHILVFVILAKLSGEDRLTGIAEWVSHRKEALANALGLDRPQAPHRTTYSRILGKTLSVESLEDALREFFTADRTDGHLVQIAIDGKSLRGSIATGQKRGVHLLAAYLPNEGVVLAQVEVDGKRNEITAAPSLLKAVDLRHKVVSADAMLAQRGLSDQVVESGGEYIWTVKGNQPSLREDIATLFEGAESCEDERRAEGVNKGHGRIEKRGIRASSMLNDYLDWPHVQQVFEIKRHIRYIRDGKTTDEKVYGITSLSPDQVSAKGLLEMVRNHWGIENGLHYRRDETLREDWCHMRLGHSQRMMATINNLISGLLLRRGVKNVPRQRRRYAARWDEAIRLITASG